MHVSLRSALWTLVALLLVAALGLAVFRYVLLPHVDSLRPQVEQRLGLMLGRPVHLGPIRGDWRDGHVTLTVAGLRIDDRHGVPLLQASRLSGRLSWFSLLVGEPRFRALEVDGLVARFNRDQINWFLGDLPLNAPPGRRRSDHDFDAVDWVLRQYGVELAGARLELHDLHHATLGLVVQDVYLDYRRGFLSQNLTAQWRLEGSAAVGHMSANWDDLRAERWQHWQGDARVDVSALPVAAVAQWLPWPRWSFAGFVEGHAQIGVQQGRLQRGSAWLAVHGVRATAASAPAIDIRDGYVAVDEHFSSREGYVATVRGLRVALAGQGALSLPPLQLTYRPELGALPAVGLVRVSGVDVGSLVALGQMGAASGWPLAPVVNYLSQAKAAGQVQTVQYQWSGPWASPLHEEAAVQLGHLALGAVGAWPGLSAVDARVSFKDSLADLTLASRALHIEAPPLWAHGLDLGQVESHLQLQYQHSAWQVAVSMLSIRGPDVTGEWGGSFVQTPTGGNMDVRGHVAHIHLPAIVHYLPQTLPADVLAWFAGAFPSGEAVDGDLIARGSLSQFPFVDGKGGLFRFTAKVQDATLHYAERWPDITGLSGHLRFEGHGMQFLADHATLMGAEVGATRVDIANLEKGDTLTVDGRVNGAAQNFVNYVNQSPLRTPLAATLNRLHLDGPGSLDLQLMVPLQHADDTQVQGAYTFNHASLHGDAEIPALSAIDGVLHFTESAVTVNQATAQTLGGKTVLSMSTSKTGAITLEANGNADIGQVARFYALPLSGRVRGSSDYRLVLGLEGNQNTVQVQSNLEGVDIDLPEPFGKRAADGRSLRIKSRALDANHDRWQIVYQQRLAAVLSLNTDAADHTTLVGGEVRVGSTDVSEPTHPGLWITGHLARLRIEDWQGLWSDGSEAGALPLGLDVSIDALQWQGRTWSGIAVTLAQQGGHWHGQLHSPLTSGTLDISGGAHPAVNARLDTLVWDSEAAGAGAAGGAGKSSTMNPGPMNPALWPELTASIGKLMHNNRDLGRLDFHGAPLTAGYHMDRLQLANSDGTATLHGNILATRSGYALNTSLKLTFSNAGQLAARWGYDQLLKKGEGEITADLRAMGPDLLPDRSSLTGRIQFNNVKKGVFLKVEPGVGRLLGLFSVQEWMRRIRFDLSDVFAEGLAFDKLDAAANIDQGLVVVDNFDLSGPAMTLSAAGTVNVNSRALDGKLKVVPAVGGGLSAATALINPVYGLTLLLAQQLLNNPLGKVLAYTYRVGGTLDDPKLTAQGGL